MILRWSAAGMLEAERSFRKIAGSVRHPARRLPYPAEQAGRGAADSRLHDRARTPQENWYLSLNPAIRQFASDEMLTLLGFKTTGLGLVNGRSPQ